MVCAVIASIVRRGILRYLPRRNIPTTVIEQIKRKDKDLSIEKILIQF